jgi:polyisoprenoid-binding protein YceI
MRAHLPHGRWPLVIPRQILTTTALVARSQLEGRLACSLRVRGSAAASIDTKTTDRDVHLKSQDVFFVDKHPEITFVSSRITRKGS